MTYWIYKNNGRNLKKIIFGSFGEIVINKTLLNSPFCLKLKAGKLIKSISKKIIAKGLTKDKYILDSSKFISRFGLSFMKYLGNKYYRLWQ